MRKEEYIIDDKMFVRIPKSIARKIYTANIPIIFAPCLANLNSPWCYYSPFKKCDVDFEDNGDVDFDTFLGFFDYYNLHQGMGNYTKFFVNQYDLISYELDK